MKFNRNKNVQVSIWWISRKNMIDIKRKPTLSIHSRHKISWRMCSFIRKLLEKRYLTRQDLYCCICSTQSKFAAKPFSLKARPEMLLDSRQPRCHKLQTSVEETNEGLCWETSVLLLELVGCKTIPRTTFICCFQFKLLIRTAKNNTLHWSFSLLHKKRSELEMDCNRSIQTKDVLWLKKPLSPASTGGSIP
jgi:hypothetical protein